MKRKIFSLMIMVFSMVFLLSIKSNAFVGSHLEDVIYDAYKDDYSKFYIRDGIYFFEKANFTKDNTLMFRANADGVRKENIRKRFLQ